MKEVLSILMNVTSVVLVSAATAMLLKAVLGVRAEGRELSKATDELARCAYRTGFYRGAHWTVENLARYQNLDCLAEHIESAAEHTARELLGGSDGSDGRDGRA